METLEHAVDNELSLGTTEVRRENILYWSYMRNKCTVKFVHCI